jgi:hypothetical protein
MWTHALQYYTTRCDKQNGTTWALYQSGMTQGKAISDYIKDNNNNTLAIMKSLFNKTT